MNNFFAEICDVVMNGRSAAESTGTQKQAVNWPELIKRKTSYVLIKGKTYRVTVEPVKLQAAASGVRDRGDK